MNFQLVARITGLLLLLEAGAMVLCGLFAYFDVVEGNEDATMALFISGGITAGISSTMILLGGFRKKFDRMPRREAVVVVGLGWVLSSLFGGLPFLLCPPGLNPAAAFFEAASGFTTTGSSVIADLELWPRGLLLWRSVIQWLGGIGILVLFVAVLSYLGVGSKSLFHNESSFRSGEAGLARIQDTAVSLLRIYFTLSVACMVGLRLLGLTWFNAVCHTMTTVSTGGYSPHNESIAYYSGWGNGLAIELWIVLFMTVCSLNFLLFVVIIRKNWRRFVKEEDARWFLGICGTVMVAIAAGRTLAGQAEFLEALRESVFVVITIASTCGFGTADYQTWPAWSQVLLALLMLMGGCSGSTAGGFKVGRLLVFIKSARYEIIRTFRPNQVGRLLVNGNQIDDAARARTMFFLTMYFMIIVFSTAVVGFFEAGTGISLETCASAVLATISNIGPGFGSVGPKSNFAHLREPTQLFLSWLMILGRLELFAVLVLFLPTAWRKY